VWVLNVKNVFKRILILKKYIGKNRKSEVNLSVKTKSRSSPKTDDLAGNIIGEMSPNLNKFVLHQDFHTAPHLA